MSGAGEHLWVVNSTTDSARGCIQIDEQGLAFIGQSRTGPRLPQRAGAGKGREFVPRLPLDASSPGDGAEPDGLEPSRVLIVDDDQDVAGSLAMLIESLGAETRIAYDGASAVEAAVEFAPEVALIDIRMDGVDGYETARRVRARLGAGTPLMVALTGLGQDRDREAAIEAGFDLHLTKPVSADALEQVLRGVKR